MEADQPNQGMKVHPWKLIYPTRGLKFNHERLSLFWFPAFLKRHPTMEAVPNQGIKVQPWKLIYPTRGWKFIHERFIPVLVSCFPEKASNHGSCTNQGIKVQPWKLIYPTRGWKFIHERLSLFWFPAFLKRHPTMEAGSWSTQPGDESSSLRDYIAFNLKY